MTSWLDDRQARAWRAFFGLFQPLETALNRQLAADSGLSLADYHVLVVLSESEGHSVRVRELAEFTGWEKSRLSHQLRRMEARGLVSRERCPSDARGSFVRLTAEGMVTVQQAAPAHVAEVRRLVIDQLTPEQLDQLIEIGRTIGEALVPRCAEHDSDGP